MLGKSHVDREKLERVPLGQSFEYKDVVSDDLPEAEHSIDGKRFKDEVEGGSYDNIVIDKDTGNRLLYKKLKSNRLY